MQKYDAMFTVSPHLSQRYLGFKFVKPLLRFCHILDPFLYTTALIMFKTESPWYSGNPVFIMTLAKSQQNCRTPVSVITMFALLTLDLTVV